MYLKINPENPQDRQIRKAVDILGTGGVIVYPTDTFYGIGCDIMNKKAIENIYLLKQRDRKQPFSFICPNLKHISKYAKVSNFAYKHMKRLLPGPYTFILTGSKMVPKIMLTKRKTAGIRVPNHNIALELAGGLGNPIISTSALDIQGDSFDTPELLYEQLSKKVDGFIDGGNVPSVPSSVISLVGDVPEIIRYGAGDVEIFE